MKKKIYLLLIVMFISNCGLNTVENNHGTPYLEKKEKKLIVNQTNKNDILKSLGAPSTKSFFDNDLWIYIEKTTTRSSLIKLGKKKDLKSNILVLEIDNKGLLAKKDFYTLDNVNEINFSKDTTMNSDKNSFVYGFISTFRQKVDSPKRRRSVKKR